MLRAILRTPDGQSGLFFAFLGVAVAVGSLQHPLGTPSQMGPGFFPFALGVLLAMVGLVVLVQAPRTDPDLPPIDWRALGIVTGSVVLSATLLLTAGLLVAIPTLVVISSLAARNPRPLPILLNAIALTVMSYVVFIQALGLRIPVWGG